MGDTDDPMQTDTVTIAEAGAETDANETKPPNTTVTTSEPTEPTASLTSDDKVSGDTATTTVEDQVEEESEAVAVAKAEVPQVAAEDTPVDAAAVTAPVANADDKAPEAETVVPPAVTAPTTTATSEATTLTTTNATTQHQHQPLPRQYRQIKTHLQTRNLQAQLQAAASRGHQANITPEQIQQQAQAMVQAAAQAQAVVAAAKSRGDGLVPMNAAQIQALSQIQAQAIVHARKTTGTPQQVQTQIQLQAQALVHAHTQAQIQAGIYKGDTSKMTTAQQQQQHDMVKKHQREKAAAATTAAAGGPTSEKLGATHKQQMEDLQATFRKQNAVTPPQQPLPALVTTSVTSMDTDNGDNPAPSATSPQFLAKLHATLSQFWTEQFHLVQQLPPASTEQDFKTHNDLPLARIKRIMKSDEDVRMISAEAPVLFAKACELFILELTLRSWSFSQHHKRRTLQKEDIKEAIQRTDVFDFWWMSFNERVVCFPRGALSWGVGLTVGKCYSAMYTSNWRLEDGFL
ncbi:Histone-like transcription factor (CBF/NF-Y) and archaeal histone [Fragilaria crotonensis]|nr:Histone-like transcription factor (CBF/NF-Y) and archaeal histone [Fragilaria crotonensis]